LITTKFTGPLVIIGWEKAGNAKERPASKRKTKFTEQILIHAF